MANHTRAPTWTTPGAGITLGWDQNSEALHIVVCVVSGLALYNAVELVIMIFLTFRRRGLYFWSLLISSIGIIPYSTAFMLKFLDITDHGNWKWAPYVMLTLGWWPMIIGQALVLWSRLHLIVFGRKADMIIRTTKWMIICTSIFLCIPTTTLTIASGGTYHHKTLTFAYNIMEKIQMFGFCTQETILSSIYIVETARLFRTSLHPDTRIMMRQLLTINVVIIIMDLSLLGLECASLYILETVLKGLIYSVKLKLEFAILGKLVKFVSARQPGTDAPNETLIFNDFAFEFATVTLYHSEKPAKIVDTETSK